MKRNVRQRAVRPSVMIVGEGAAEIALIRNVRDLFCGDRQGCAVSHSNAHGKGAGNVINSAIRIKQRAAYTQVAAMFDTDTGWNDSVQAKARRHGILCLPSAPCLEASLLDVLGLLKEGNQKEQKARFLSSLHGPAHEDGLLARHFTRDVLEEARERVEFLQDLLTLIRV
jgi:hypothetical protein